MEFFREHKKIIMLVIVISFLLWTVAPILLALISHFHK